MSTFFKHCYLTITCMYKSKNEFIFCKTNKDPSVCGWIFIDVCYCVS